MAACVLHPWIRPSQRDSHTIGFARRVLTEIADCLGAQFLLGWWFIFCWGGGFVIVGVVVPFLLGWWCLFCWGDGVYLTSLDSLFLHVTIYTYLTRAKERAKDI